MRYSLFEIRSTYDILMTCINSFDKLSDIELCDNSIIERKIKICKHLNEFFPNDIAKLINEYYYLKKIYMPRDNMLSYLFVLPDSDGRIIYGYHTNAINVWNAQTKQYTITSMKHGDIISCICILSDGRLVTGSYDKTIKVWNVNTEKCEMTLFGHSNRVRCIATLYDDRIVSGSEDETIKIWDVKTKKCNITNMMSHECNISFKAHNFYVICVAELPDKRIVSGSYDRTIKIWSLRSGSPVCDITLLGHSSWITCINILHEGPEFRLISGSLDCRLKIWNPYNGKCETTFIGHLCTVTNIGILSDGKIISRSYDKTFKIWDRKTQECDTTFDDNCYLPFCLVTSFD
jgi:WD40 repeat protein